MLEDILQAHRIVRYPARKCETSRSAGNRLESKRCQITCTPDVPCVGNDEAPGTMQVPKFCPPLFDNGTHNESVCDITRTREINMVAVARIVDPTRVTIPRRSRVIVRHGIAKIQAPVSHHTTGGA